MTGSHFQRIGISALAIAALTLTACGSAASSGGSAGGSGTPSQTLSIGYDSDPAPQGYDPLLYGAGQRLFYESLYQSLFVQTSTGGVAPELVTSFSYNASKTQLTLKLKSGVTFTDGSKLTAQLVKENLDRRSDAKLQSYGAFATGGADQITNVTAPDASTVVLTFAAPQATFQTNLAGVPGMIVGQHGISDPAGLQTAPDGSGPYKLSSAVKGSSYTMTREPGAAAATYPYAAVVYKPFLDKQARANAQISGQTDVSVLDPSTVPMAASNGVSVVKNGGTIQTLLIFDKTGVTAKPFGSKLVRLALSYAIDRSAYVDAIAKGSVPTASAFPQASPGYDPSLNAAYAFSDAKAKQLLAQAGYPHGFSFTITASPTDEAQLEFIQKQFAAIGVTMNITGHHLDRPAVRRHQHPADGLRPADMGQRDRHHGGRARRRLRQPAPDERPGDRGRARRGVQLDRRRVPGRAQEAERRPDQRGVGHSGHRAVRLRRLQRQEGR